MGLTSRRSQAYSLRPPRSWSWNLARSRRAWLVEFCRRGNPRLSRADARRSYLLHGSCNRAQVWCDRWVLGCHFIQFPDLHIGGYNARPFRARAEEPTTLPDEARGVERVARDQKLDPLPCPDVRADDDTFGAAVRVQQEYLERVPEIVVIKLVIADPMEADRCPRRNQKIQSGT